MQRVAVDAKAGGGLDLDAVAGLEHLLDQLALNLADDAVVKVVGAGPRAADALADKLDGQAAEVAAAAMADRPGADSPRNWGGRCSTRSSEPVPRITARST